MTPFAALTKRLQSLLWSRGGARKSARKSSSACRPNLEALESRLCLSTSSAIAFSTVGYGGPVGDALPGTVGKPYSQTIYLGSDPSQKYDVSLPTGWNLPPGLQLQYPDGTPSTNGVLSGVSKFRVAGTTGVGPSAAGQYNLAILATGSGNNAAQDTVIYHFLINPSPSSFHGIVSSRMGPASGMGSALGFNSLVLPPGIVDQPYQAQIKVANGKLRGVSLLTQINGGELASAVNVQTPVPGLVGGQGGNVKGVDQVSGNLAKHHTANVAGLKIRWSDCSNSVVISGVPKISVGGLNDPLILRLTGPNGQAMDYDLSITRSPAQIARAYGVPNVLLAGGIQGDGAGQTVAILAVGDNSAFVSSTNPNFPNSDLSMFNQRFGLNNFNQPGGPVFLKVDDAGGSNYPPQTTGTDDPTEVPQDIEWLHALAPQANLVVIESPSGSNFQNALALIANWSIPGIPAPTVVSSSFGAASMNSGPFAPNVTYVASSGDFGPSGFASSNVLVAGYAQLKVSHGGKYSSEQGVNGGTMQTTGKTFQSGGGVDSSQSQPGYQQFIPNQSTNPNPLGSSGRTSADVAFNGAEPSGVAVYDSFINTSGSNFKSGGVNYGFGGTPWGNAWGTSITAPSWAALMSIANQGRKLAGKGALDGPTQTLPILYSLANTPAFHKIAKTINQSTQKVAPLPTASGSAVYNQFTGLGSPVANLLIAQLVSQD